MCRIKTELCGTGAESALIFTAICYSAAHKKLRFRNVCVNASAGQESQLFHVLIYQPQLLLSVTAAAAADPIPPRLLLDYSCIIFSFMFLHEPTVATDTVCSSQYSHFPERCKLSIVEQVTTECDLRIRRLAFIRFPSAKPSPRPRPQSFIPTDSIHMWPVFLNH